jgi:small-conductance mechanosensitive channel
MDFSALRIWITPAACAAGGLLIGWLCDRIVLARLAKLAQRTSWGGDDIVIAALRGVATLWFFLAGVAVGTSFVVLKPSVETMLHKGLAVAFILSLTVVLANMTAGIVTHYASRAAGVLPTTSILRNITKLVIFVLGGLVLLDKLGIAIAPILTALGVGGLAVALALKDTLSNLFAGIQIIASGQVRVGDYVKLESGQAGYITDIKWRNTTIRELPGNVIVVPNARLSETILTNYYQPARDLAVLVEVGVAYDSDLEKVERVTVEVGREVMKGVSGGMPEFDPFIRYHTFADSSINFSVILRGQEFTDRFLITHEFVKRLRKRYRQERIEIPFPIRTVELKGAGTFPETSNPIASASSSPGGQSRQ